MLIANVVVQSGIVVTGGLVRLTGSGLGCPTWPQCDPGSYTPEFHAEMGIHPFIEFGNRLLTFAVAAAAIAALVVVWRTGRRHLRLLAAVPLVGTAAQAVLGGITVLTGLHPATVAAHFLLSMVLIAASVVLLLRVQEPDGPARLVVPQLVQRLGWSLAAVGAVVLVLGTVVTGSGPHSGDAETPARFGFDPRTVSWLHADSVLLFVGLLIGLTVALQVTGAPEVARERARLVIAVTVGQGLVGYVQYATGLPEALVAVHMLGACLLVITLTALLMSLRTREPAAVPGSGDQHDGALTPA